MTGTERLLLVKKVSMIYPKDLEDIRNKLKKEMDKMLEFLNSNLKKYSTRVGIKYIPFDKYIGPTELMAVTIDMIDSRIAFLQKGKEIFNGSQ